MWLTKIINKNCYQYWRLGLYGMQGKYIGVIANCGMNIAIVEGAIS